MKNFWKEIQIVPFNGIDYILFANQFDAVAIPTQQTELNMFEWLGGGETYPLEDLIEAGLSRDATAKEIEDGQKLYSKVYGTHFSA